MRYQTMWRQAAAPGGRTGIVAILLSAVMLLPMPAARAADQSSLATETPPAGSGPLTPVHRDSPTTAERPPGKPPAAAKAPVAANRPAETTPVAAAGTATPSPNKPEASASKPPRNTTAATPAAKPTTPALSQIEKKKPAPASTQAEKKPAPASTQAEKKPAPVERTAERERRHRHVAPETAQRRTPIYRDYAYQQPDWGYAPPRDYGEAPVEVGPGSYAPSWYYRERPLAYGPYVNSPYSGMRGPRPMPW